MLIENRPQALTEALSIAPADPLADGRLSKYATQRIEKYRTGEPIFGLIYDRTLTEAGLNGEEIPALNLYLAATAFTLASDAFPPAYSLEEDATLGQEAEAARIHLYNLISRQNPTEEAAINNTWIALYTERSHDSPSKQKSTNALPETAKEDPEKLALLRGKLQELVTEIKRKMKEEGFTPGIRDIQDYYKIAMAYAKEIGLDNPPLFNLTLGNINWVGDGWEEQFLGIPERLGLKGVKAQRIAQRRAEYMKLMERAGINLYGYKDPPLGWPALLQRHKDYLRYWGFTGPYQDGKAFLAYGGSDGARRTFLIARETIKNGSKATAHPKLLFPTPGFIMIAQEAMNVGIEVVELPTQASNGFHPTEEQIMQKLHEDPSIRILDLTPYTNPGTTIGSPEQYDRIFRALEKYKKATGITIYVVLDLAYLGQGDEEKNRELVKVLDTYKHRFDIIPTSTKIWQQPALRCCGVFTPDEDLAAHIVGVLRSDTITISYSMQTEALAISDFVTIDDIRAGMEVWRFRQERMQEILRERPDIFQSVMADSTLYTCNILAPGIDPVDLIRAGFFFTPDNGFYMPGTIPEQRFVRAALGMMAMTERNVARMKKALREATITEL